MKWQKSTTKSIIQLLWKTIYNGYMWLFILTYTFYILFVLIFRQYSVIGWNGVLPPNFFPKCYDQSETYKIMNYMFLDQYLGGCGWLVAFNAISNNISVIWWRSVLLVEETGVPGENHKPPASHWQTLLHNVASSTPRHKRDSNSQL